MIQGEFFNREDINAPASPVSVLRLCTVPSVFSSCEYSVSCTPFPSSNPLGYEFKYIFFSIRNNDSFADFPTSIFGGRRAGEARVKESGGGLGLLL